MRRTAYGNQAGINGGETHRLPHAETPLLQWSSCGSLSTHPSRVATSASCSPFGPAASSPHGAAEADDGCGNFLSKSQDGVDAVLRLRSAIDVIAKKHDGISRCDLQTELGQE